MSRFFFTQTNQASPGDRVRFFASGTTDPVTVYADAEFATARAQPIEEVGGVFPEVFVSGSALLRVLVTDKDDVPLPGYPIDNVRVGGGGGTASSVSFSPTENVPKTTVQAAIEHVSDLASQPSLLVDRSLTPWPTSGSGNDFTISPVPAIVAYTSPLTFMVRPNRANTGAATLNVNGLGARPLQRINSAGTPVGLAEGEISPWQDFIAVYDGTRFVISIGDRGYVGTNENGTFVRHPNGWQDCQILTATLTYSSANLLVCDWTFPVPFLETPFVSVIGAAGNDNYTGMAQRDLGWLRYNAGTTAANIQLFRNSASTDPFEAGDTITNMRFKASGRY